MYTYRNIGTGLEYSQFAYTLVAIASRLFRKF